MIRPQCEVGKPEDPPLPEAIANFVETAAALFDVDRSTSYEFLNRAVALVRTTRALQRDGAASRHRGPPESGGLAVWQLDLLMGYIDANLSGSLNGNDLARLVNVSTGHFFRAFKASVGVTPFHYILRRRLDLACKLMVSTDQPVSEIAIACGLYDQSHLCKIFQQMVGESPGAWRRKKRLRFHDSEGARLAASLPAVAINAAPDQLRFR